MSRYRTLGNYSGRTQEPEYSGMEYDWEVPDDTIIGSPGGISSVHHHWTKGFDGRGNSSGDIFAGQSDRYISGNYGSMYDNGHTASEANGYYPPAPDYEDWKNETPPQSSFSDSPQNQTTIEHFTPIEDSEEDEDKPNIWILYILVIVGFVALYFLSGTIISGFNEYFHGGKGIPLMNMAQYTILLAVLFMFIAYFSNIPIFRNE